MSERGSYGVGRLRRDRILDVAVQQFTERGYPATSMARIAKAAGLTAPGLTHHFPTKQHLLLAVMDRRFGEAAEIAAEAPADTDGTGPLRLILRIAQRMSAHPELIVLSVYVAAEAADPLGPAHELYRRRHRRVVDELGAAFRSSEARGLLRPADYDEIVRECLAVADGLQLQWMVTHGAVDIVAGIRSHLERLAPHILADGREVSLLP